MSEQTNIEALQMLAQRLKELVDNPEPGLFTWHAFLAKTAGEINKIVNGK